MRSRLKVVLAERRLRQKEVARRLGVDKSSVWRWTTDEGIAQVSLGTLASLARAVGCEVEDLYER